MLMLAFDVAFEQFVSHFIHCEGLPPDGRETEGTEDKDKVQADNVNLS